MVKYLTYDIEALEDVKLAKTNMQTNSEVSMEYITGSSIRGAYIYKYIKKYGIKDINQGIHREKLLKGGIKFLNAYPEFDRKRSIPFPKIYFALKEDMRQAEEMSESLNVELGLDRKLSPEHQRVCISEFIGSNGYEYYRIKVDKNTNLHINKDDEKNKLFRYESIKRGQLFKGVIKVEDKSYVDEIKDLFNNSYVYIGGSKGSGYGRCKITNMEVEEENPEYKIFEHKDGFENYIYLIALSDIVYKNNLGEYKTFIEDEYICKELGLKEVTYVDSIIETKNITNYNNKWNCRTPQIVGIKAGSVFKYEIKGEINRKKLLDFINGGIGDRKVDGFGRFVIVDSVEENIKLCFPEKVDIEKEYNTLYKKLNENEKEQLKDVVNRIYKTRVEDYIGDIVLKVNKDIENPEEMTQNQWGNYKDLFSYLAILEPEEGIQKYREYREDIKNKGSISYEQLSKVKYRKEDLEYLFNKMIENSIDINMFYEETFKDINKVRIGNIVSEIDKKFTYQINLKILIELIRYQIRAIDKERIEND